MIRVSVYLQNIQTLTDEELLRVITACDYESARCKVAAKSTMLVYKLQKLLAAKNTFVSEQNSRQTIEC